MPSFGRAGRRSQSVAKPGASARPPGTIRFVGASKFAAGPPFAGTTSSPVRRNAIPEASQPHTQSRGALTYPLLDAQQAVLRIIRLAGSPDSSRRARREARTAGLIGGRPPARYPSYDAAAPCRSGIRTFQGNTQDGPAGGALSERAADSLAAADRAGSEVTSSLR
jgi:hypothetical protein